jgi:hypothetical protein
MGQTAEVIQFDAAALDAWHKRLDAARGTAVEQILRFAGECAEFKQACDRTQGGSTYSAKMREWFGIDQAIASHWAIVGAHREKLSVATLSLPPSMHTLYELCTVPAEVIAEKVTPKTTQVEARAMKAKHAPKKTKKAKKPEYAEGIYKRFANAGFKEAIDSNGRRKLMADLLPMVGLSAPPKPSEWTTELSDIVNDAIARMAAARNSRYATEIIEAGKAEIRTKSASEKFDSIVNRTVKAINAQLQESFASAVQKKVDVIVAEKLADITRREAKLAEEVESFHRQVIDARRDVTTYMTESEFKLVLGCLHPDQTQRSKERLEKAFHIFNRLTGYIMPLGKAIMRERGWTV